ncbi:MAG: PAS domain-containing protein [Sulfuricellaceae bacterium]|nr:PAS domain-containing protein [Sulfuricellaceae bacterium]
MKTPPALARFFTSEALPADPYWQTLHYFTLYRLTVAGIFVVSFVLFGATLTYGASDPQLFFLVSILYAAFSSIATLLVSRRWPYFDLQLSLQVLTDIVFITVLMSASGGIRSGLGLLLVVTLAAAGLTGRGRMAIFYAAVASLAVLAEQSYRVTALAEEAAGYIHTALLSIVFFATAWLAHTMASRTKASEKVAREKAIDLENQAQVNQLVIQDMDDGVLVVDGDNRVHQVNAMAAALLGKDPAGSGMRLDDYAPAVAELLARWRLDPETAKVLRIASTGRSLRVRFVPVGQGGQPGAVIFLKDQGRVQAQAQQFKLAALGRLTANIAHEIRNPLSAISYSSELLLEDEETQASQSRLLHIIQDNTRRLEKIVQDVLQLNRRDRAQPEAVDMEAFVNEFVEDFCQIEKIGSDIFSLDIEEACVVCFDRAHLNQVLWNLCRNALRYCSGRPASIRIALRRVGMKNYGVELNMIDDGPGVEESDRGKLFEPFFTTASQGSGLGLYVAKEICEANGATLDYLAEGPGAWFKVLCKGEPC